MVDPDQVGVSFGEVPTKPFGEATSRPVFPGDGGGGTSAGGASRPGP